MTSVQWYWEFLALREKEKEEFEQISGIMAAFRRMLINVLGLDLLKSKKKEGDEEEKDEEESFMPLSLIAGRREVVEHILESIREDQIVEEFVEDDEFEKMSAAIASGEIGDMDPILDTSDMDGLAEKVKKEEMDQQLQALGIKTVNRDRSVAHLSLDVPELKSRMMKSKLDRVQGKKQIETLEEEGKKQQKEAKERGVKLTFDEN